MSDNESDLSSTIMAFEQILEVIPDDRGALEAVVSAYDDLGDHTQAKQYTLRLARVLIDDGDIEAAAEYLERLRMYAVTDPDVAALIAEIEQPTAGDAPSTPTDEAPVGNVGAATPPRSDTVRMGLSIADEMAFAWQLQQSGHLAEEEYANVVQDLIDLAAGNQAGTVSVLHVLYDRGFKNFERLLSAIATESSVPLILLQQFDMQRDTAEALPLPFIIHRGAVPFERMGPDVLVALLNPYDENLRKDAEALAGRKCHWFLATPAGFDATVNVIKSMLSGA